MVSPQNVFLPLAYPLFKTVKMNGVWLSETFELWPPSQGRKTH